MSRAHSRFLIACATLATTACGGAGASGAGPAAAPVPAETPVPAPPPPAAAPTQAEVSAQVRSTRSACSAEATKQKLEVVDFVTFNRLDESNWDSTVRVRRNGRLIRVGCRYDLKAAASYIYEPSASDGGNPWGPAGAPKAAAAPVTSGPAPVEPKTDAKAEPRPAPARSEPKPAPPKPEPKAEPKAKPVPGSNIDFRAIPDSTARAAIARTRDACLAEAARRRIAFDDFDAFRRVDGTRWEAILLIKKGKGSSRSCQVDVGTGKATIK